MGFHLLRRNTTGEAGQFDLTDVVLRFAADEFDVVVRAEGYEFAIVRLRRQTEPHEIRLVPGQGFGVKGRARDRNSGEPIAKLEMTVVVQPAARPDIVSAFPVVTDTDARFDIRSLPPGRARIEVDEGQFEGRGRQATIVETSREPTDVDLQVARPARLRIEVRRPDGQLAKDVRVILREPGNLNAAVHPASRGIYERPHAHPRSRAEDRRPRRDRSGPRRSRGRAGRGEASRGRRPCVRRGVGPRRPFRGCLPPRHRRVRDRVGIAADRVFRTASPGDRGRGIGDPRRRDRARSRPEGPRTRRASGTPVPRRSSGHGHGGRGGGRRTMAERRRARRHFHARRSEPRARDDPCDRDVGTIRLCEDLPDAR